MARRGSRRHRHDDPTTEASAYRQLRNPFRPTDILNADAVELIHDASMRILEETGMRILDPDARETLRQGGFDVIEDEKMVRFDRDGIAELVAKAPNEVTVRGRDPRKRIRMGNGYMAFAAVGGPPFSSDLDRGRRHGTYDDMCRFMKLVQMLDIIHMEGGQSIEPTDLPVRTRHLDFYLAGCLLTDKPLKPLSIGTTQATDALAMARILHQCDDDALAADPVYFVNTNTNTPLVLDEDITRGVRAFAKAGQPICVTPFALSGAMAPATMAGALAMQNAETLAACALVQLIRPGCPYIYGSFASNVDMKTGSPAFGTPEYALGAQASGQLARRYGLPWRSSNVNSSKAPDAQAAYESQMSIWGAITGHVGVLNQGAGWLEGGLVASFEKLIIDAEMLRMMAAWMDGLSVTGDDIGLESIREVGPGGHFFGTQHTLDRYQDAFYSPLVSDWSNYENWHDKGAPDTAVLANRVWKNMLAGYQAPAIDPGVKEELEAFVERRKAEINNAGE